MERAAVGRRSSMMPQAAAGVSAASSIATRQVELRKMNPQRDEQGLVRRPALRIADLMDAVKCVCAQG
ncbi:hypothetical protein GCM10009780_27360 [Actinomadura alba]